jgi:hypothetical protein
VSKVFGVCLVHLLEIGHVIEEYVDLISRLVIGISFAGKLKEMRESTLITLSIELPASLSTASRFLQHWAVLSPMLPSMSLPVVGSIGTWPEQKMVPPAWMAGVWREAG